MLCMRSAYRLQQARICAGDGGDAGNVRDSAAFDAVFERLQVQAVTADAGYKTPWVCKPIFDNRRTPSPPYKVRVKSAASISAGMSVRGISIACRCSFFVFGVFLTCLRVYQDDRSMRPFG